MKNYQYLKATQCKALSLIATILAIMIRTALKCHNLLNLNRSEVNFFFKIRFLKRSFKWDQAGSCIFIRLEMRAEWRKYLLFASVVGKFLRGWCTPRVLSSFESLLYPCVGQKSCWEAGCIPERERSYWEIVPPRCRRIPIERLTVPLRGRSSPVERLTLPLTDRRSPNGGLDVNLSGRVGGPV